MSEDASELLSNDEATKLASTIDVTLMDERRLQHLRSSYSHLCCRALLVVGQIVLFSDWYGGAVAATKEKEKEKKTTHRTSTATTTNTTTTTDTTTTLPTDTTTTLPTDPAASTVATTDTAAPAKMSHQLKKTILGATPRSVSQLMSRQRWISNENRLGFEFLFGILLRNKMDKKSAGLGFVDVGMYGTAAPAAASNASSIAHPATASASALTATASTSPSTTPPGLPGAGKNTQFVSKVLGQLTQTLSRLLYHCCAQPIQEHSSLSSSNHREATELLGTHQKVSLIIQRWIKDYTIGKENELYTESVALSTFKEEEIEFKSHMSKLKSKWKTQQQKLILACMEADHLFCLLVTLDRRFLMQHGVVEEERRLFTTTVSKLSKMQQYHNEHVYGELQRWRVIIKEGVVFEEGSLLHASSIKVERALQRRVVAEICNMSFIVLSALWAVVMGGHLNYMLVGFGPVYTPSWWPSLWFGHSILGLLVVASVSWNWFNLDTFVCGPSGNIAEVNGFEAMAQLKGNNNPVNPYVLSLWYRVTGACGCKKGMALLVIIVGLLTFVTMALTIMILRGIGIVVALQ